MVISRVEEQDTVSIEEMAVPLAFKTRSDHPGADAVAGKLAMRSEVRALQGMQKEALVHHGPTGESWRMVSDEGPYLNGTDLAPFPLAFYTAGVVFSFMNEALRHAAAAGIQVDEFAITSDHYYSMQGSAMRGDMVGGARSVDLTILVDSNADRAVIERLLQRALATSPAEAYMRDALANTFSVFTNGRMLELERLRPAPRPIEAGEDAFEDLSPATGDSFDDIISKLSTAEVVHGVAGGAGSSLQSVQKRDLHVRGEATMLSATRKQIQVRLLQPIGSSFRFVSEDGGARVAPPALAYLSAGLGFCFMTQIGRYAQITKRALIGYRVIQDNLFTAAGDEEAALASADPVNTSLYLTGEEPDDIAEQIAFMGEQTCFLHAALRGEHPTTLHLTPPVAR